jgi:hypothetical protein
MLWFFSSSTEIEILSDSPIISFPSSFLNSLTETHELVMLDIQKNVVVVPDWYIDASNFHDEAVHEARGVVGRGSDPPSFYNAPAFSTVDTCHCT